MPASVGYNDQVLTGSMQRVLIAGIGGSGKSTLARRLAPVLGLPAYTLDDLYYGPGLVMAEDFPARIDQITQGPAWLFDSQGPPPTSQAPPAVREMMWSRADTLIWLAYPKRIVMGRVVRRTARRILTREEFLPGYRESPLALLDPTHPVRRAWRLYDERRAELTERTADPAWSHLRVLRFSHPRETASWLDGLTRASTPPDPSS